MLRRCRSEHTYYHALIGLVSMFVLQCIERIEGLSGCPKLQKLWLMENRISKIEGLEACTGLQELYLYSNRISSITGLDHLTGLKV
jgi:Leucine-rich repeat (LRR) protein